MTIQNNKKFIYTGRSQWDTMFVSNEVPFRKYGVINYDTMIEWPHTMRGFKKCENHLTLIEKVGDGFKFPMLLQEYLYNRTFIPVSITEIDYSFCSLKGLKTNKEEPNIKTVSGYLPENMFQKIFSTRNDYNASMNFYQLRKWQMDNNMCYYG